MYLLGNALVIVDTLTHSFSQMLPGNRHFVEVQAPKSEYKSLIPKEFMINLTLQYFGKNYTRG